MITKRYKDEIFAWDSTAFGGKGYWYVLGTKGGLGRAASRKEAKFLGKPLEKISDVQVDKDLKEESKGTEEEEEKEEMSPRQMKRLKYERARIVRRTGLSDLITSRLVSGQGIGRSVVGSIGEKISARTTGLKQAFDLREKLDPLNIAKFLTGGSSLGPALLGRLLGRKQEDIEYFSGFGSRGGRRRRLGTASLISSALTGKKITPLPQDGGVSDVANQLYGLFSEYFEQRKQEQAKRKAFEEENKNEDDRRHQEIINALMSIGAKKPTATKVKEGQEDKKSGIIDVVSDMFGLGKTALNVLRSIGLFFTGPVGLAILGATSVAALGYFLFKTFTSETAFEDKDSELSKGIRQAEKVGGLAGAKKLLEEREKLPEYERTLLDIKDFQENNNEGQPLNDVQLEMYRKRGPQASKAVDEYIKQTRPQQKVEPEKSSSSPSMKIPTAETVQSGLASLAGNMEKVAEDLRPQMESMATALQVPMAEAAGRIEGAIKENVDLQMLETKMQEVPTILNNVAAAATAEKTETGVTGPVPIRNDDDSIMRALRQSFRTV
jgi:hypothetical protein